MSCFIGAGVGTMHTRVAHILLLLAPGPPVRGPLIPTIISPRVRALC